MPKPSDPKWPREFPFFPAADLPPIPSDWTDTSWRNDTCPSFETPAGTRIFVDFADPEEREFQDCPRFSAWSPQTDDDVAASNDWGVVLAAVAAFEAKA